MGEIFLISLQYTLVGSVHLWCCVNATETDAIDSESLSDDHYTQRCMKA